MDNRLWREGVAFLLHAYYMNEITPPTAAINSALWIIPVSLASLLLMR